MKISNIHGILLYSDKSKTLKNTLQNAAKYGADLYRADLRGTLLFDADLRGAKGIN